MSIDTRTQCVAFHVSPEYYRTSLSPVAANFVMRRALQGQAGHLEHLYGPKDVKESLRVVSADGEFIALNHNFDSTEYLAELKAKQASDPFKDDYADVRAQRQYALASAIASAEEVCRMAPPVFTERVASVVTSALLQRAISGSFEDADVLLSEHTPAMWERATGIPEVPEDIFPRDSVVIMGV